MKALIPAAGHGTRFLPVTRVVPKEMLPVGSKPAIQLIVEEALAAGADEVEESASSEQTRCGITVRDGWVDGPQRDIAREILGECEGTIISLEAALALRLDPDCIPLSEADKSKISGTNGSKMTGTGDGKTVGAGGERMMGADGGRMVGASAQEKAGLREHACRNTNGRGRPHVLRRVMDWLWKRSVA